MGTCCRILRPIRSYEPFAESHPARIGHITLDVKHTGKPSAGNLPAGFDVGIRGFKRAVADAGKETET